MPGLFAWLAGHWPHNKIAPALVSFLNPFKIFLSHNLFVKIKSPLSQSTCSLTHVLKWAKFNQSSSSPIEIINDQISVGLEYHEPFSVPVGTNYFNKFFNNFKLTNYDC